MPITVLKTDHAGREILRYAGRTLARGATWIMLEARFSRDDVHADYTTFRKGDRFIEWFYTDRWYNIFELHDVSDDHLKGWYCNIARPAVIDADTVRADDLALDMFVAPDGTIRVLDEDEFAALPLDETTRQQARHALHALIRQVETRQPPFDSIP